MVRGDVHTFEARGLVRMLEGQGYEGGHEGDLAENGQLRGNEGEERQVREERHDREGEWCGLSEGGGDEEQTLEVCGDMIEDDRDVPHECCSVVSTIGPPSRHHRRRLQRTIGEEKVADVSQTRVGVTGGEAAGERCDVVFTVDGDGLVSYVLRDIAHVRRYCR